MDFFNQLYYNQTLWTTALAWFVAQMFKVILVLMTERKFDFRRFIGSGGMPSSHSAFVTSLAVMVGFEHGFDSSLFAICFVLALVVMYDASGVRRAAGKQAMVLNQIIENWENDDAELQDERLKELLGHTPLEVIAGAALGVAISVIMYAFVF